MRPPENPNTALLNRARRNGVLPAEQGRLDNKEWTQVQFEKDFTLLAESRPFVLVQRKSDGVYGSLSYSGRPRTYWAFVPNDPLQER